MVPIPRFCATGRRSISWLEEQCAMRQVNVCVVVGAGYIYAAVQIRQDHLHPRFGNALANRQSPLRGTLPVIKGFLFTTLESLG